MSPYRYPFWLGLGSEEDVSVEEWSERCSVAHFGESGREVRAKGCGWPLEAKNDKEMGSSLEPPERNIARLTVWF